MRLHDNDKAQCYILQFCCVNELLLDIVTAKQPDPTNVSAVRLDTHEKNSLHTTIFCTGTTHPLPKNDHYTHLKWA